MILSFVVRTFELLLWTSELFDMDSSALSYTTTQLRSIGLSTSVLQTLELETNAAIQLERLAAK